MKKKNLLIVSSLGLASVLSVFAVVPEVARVAAGAPMTVIGNTGVVPPHLSGQEPWRGNPGIVPLYQGGSPVPTQTSFGTVGLQPGTPQDMINELQTDIEDLKAQMKAGNLTKEQKQEINKRIKAHQQEIKRLKKGGK